MEEQEKTGEALPIQDEKLNKVILNHIYCPTCKERKMDSQLTREPIGFNKQKDGSAKENSDRYMVFCGKCQTMLTIIDPKAAEELAKIVKNQPR